MEEPTKADVRELAEELRKVASTLEYVTRDGIDVWQERVVDTLMHWAVPSAVTLADQLAEAHDVEY